jgi:hypothetical protein
MSRFASAERVRRPPSIRKICSVIVASKCYDGVTFCDFYSVGCQGPEKRNATFFG